MTVNPVTAPNEALQWGHALMAWKTRDNGVPTYVKIELQWGHALMAWKTFGFW